MTESEDRRRGFRTARGCCKTKANTSSSRNVFIPRKCRSIKGPQVCCRRNSGIPYRADGPFCEECKFPVPKH